MPTKVHTEAFINFGYNRSLSIELAKQSFPDADYLLLIDADLILKFAANWDKTKLTKAAYLIKQTNPYMEYWNIRLVRASLPWVSLGVTHEYWECTDFYSRDKLHTLWIDDREDGGYKANKFERDKHLLINGIGDPDTPDYLRTRYFFYLAQTYRDLGDRKNARHWYDQRVTAGGWIEEVYVAQCEKAKLAILMGLSHELIVAEHIKAFGLRPSRAEALWQLAMYCRETERYAEGYIFAKVGKDIPLSSDILFVKRDAYEWRLLDEFAICAYWIGQFQESKEACEALLALSLHPLDAERIEKNLDFAVQKLA